MPGRGDAVNELESRLIASPRSLGVVLKAALMAAVVAAVVAGLFHSVLSEPLIDAAIGLEAAGHHGEGAEMVSRPGQKAGLFVAWLLYGAIWASLAAAALHLLRVRTARQAAGLAILFGLAVAIYPGLKYPANPPGVGEAETILFRQMTYSIALVVGLVGTACAWLAARRAGPVAGGAVLLLILGAAYVALPAHPEAAGMPSEIIAPFRVLSLTGYGVFWAVFAAALAWFWRTGREARGHHSAALPFA
jgi:hypothetical protein